MSSAAVTPAPGGEVAIQPLWRRFFSFWFAIEPIRHAWWETLVMRGIIAWAAWLTLRQPSPFDQQPQPHGLAVWGADFTWLGSEALSPYLVPLWAVCLVLYVLGAMPVLSLFPVMVASIGLGVLGNSQGAIGHTTQVLTVVLMAQWLAYLWAAIQPRTTLGMPRGFNGHQLSADWGRQALAASYVVSAITKLIESGGDWISDTPYFGLQVVKSEGMGYYDWLQPRIAESSVWLGQAMVDHPMITAVVLAGALPLELFVFLGLNNRRIALFFGVALYFFHSTVTEVMQLGFLYHKLLLLALFVNPAWWVARVVSGGRVADRVCSRSVGQ